MASCCAMPNQPRPDNPHRSIRVEDDLWRDAGEVAAEQGTTRAAVIQAALRAFVAKHRA
jgi:predicted transcriptional regulator